MLIKFIFIYICINIKTNIMTTLKTDKENYKCEIHTPSVQETFELLEELKDYFEDIKWDDPLYMDYTHRLDKAITNKWIRDIK